MKTDVLRNLFTEKYGKIPSIYPIKGSGSTRKYFRLSADGISVIGVIGDDLHENETFLNLDATLEKNGIRVPSVISVSEDNMAYLLQDLGDISLFSLLETPEKNVLSKQALDELIKIQTLPENLWIDKVGYPPFSERLVRWDLNYFKYDFLKPAGILFNEGKLEDDFDRICLNLTAQVIKVGLMYRDFQSRNVLLWNHQLWFIDFQGARKGPVTYDAVSFIWQAKAPFSFSEREELENYYIEKFVETSSKSSADRNNDEKFAEELRQQINLMKIFRTLQVLGAYGFRGLIERKSHFIESIPFAIKNLKQFLKEGLLAEYPEITLIADSLDTNQFVANPRKDGILEVTVTSFSYKKGYPQDLSGNGGGFMFDCRAIHNPGRYEEYKRLTGKDEEVINFMEKTDEAANFVDNAIKIVSPSIEKYLERGFTSLQVGFGCTGGQHRSVYCAEIFSKLIKEKYPEIKVNLHHREQDI